MKHINLVILSATVGATSALMMEVTIYLGIIPMAYCILWGATLPSYYMQDPKNRNYEFLDYIRPGLPLSSVFIGFPTFSFFLLPLYFISRGLDIVFPLGKIAYYLGFSLFLSAAFIQSYVIHVLGKWIDREGK